MSRQVLHIRHNRGELEIYLDRFFPASLEKLRKLLNIIEIDWEHRDDLLNQLEGFFRAKLCEKSCFKRDSYQRCLDCLTKKNGGEAA